MLEKSYASKALFSAAAATYAGVEDVTLDGTDVRTATPKEKQSGKLAYFSHSASKRVDTTGPTN